MYCKYLAENKMKRIVRGSLPTLAIVLSLLCGCTKEEPAGATEVAADPPSVYMKDPAFTNALAEKRAARNEVLAAREAILQQLEKLSADMRAAMPGADEAALLKELEKNPDWNSLRKRLDEAQAAFEENRKATLSVVRERLAPKKISK